MRNLKILFLAFSLLLSGVEVVFGQTGCDFLIALDNDLKGPNGHQLDHFFKTNPKGVRAWETLRNLPEEIRTDVSILTRLDEDFVAHPEFKAFLDADPSRPQKWASLNQSELSSSDFELLEWYEDVWYSGRVEINVASEISQLRYSGSKVAEVNLTDGTVSRLNNNIGFNYTVDEVAEAGVQGAIVCRNGLCGWVGGACFLSGTPVLINRSSVPIEDIEVGNQVISYDFSIRDTTVRTVSQVFESTVDKFLKVVIKGDTVFTTLEHPFYTTSGWLSAKDLQVGIQVKTLSQGFLSVDVVEIVDTTATVYNFEVDGLHNYFVGKTGFLVHNACYDVWNVGQHAVTVSHHNWNQIFGSHVPTLAEIRPYIMQVLNNSEWEVVKDLYGNGGVLIGYGLEARHVVDGHSIWVEGTKLLNGKIIVKNAGVD